MDRVPELVIFLLNMLYNDEGQTSVSQSKLLQDVLVQCLIHQVIMGRNRIMEREREVRVRKRGREEEGREEEGSERERRGRESV